MPCYDMLLAGVAALSIALATTVALVAPAAAKSRIDALPDQMLGNWCYDDDRQEYTRGTCSLGSIMVTLKRDGYKGGYDGANVGEYVSCKFKSVQMWKDSINSIRTLTGSYFIRARCFAEASFFNEEMVLQMIDDNTVIRLSVIRLKDLKNIPTIK